MSPAENKAVVQRYFDEVLDGGKGAVMAELFAIGALQHFPGRTLTFAGAVPETGYVDRVFRSTLHHLLAEGDFVVAHVRHDLSFGANARYPTRVGVVEASGRRVTWEAVAIFRFDAGRIAEEWVSRDELDILTQLGAVHVDTVG